MARFQCTPAKHSWRAGRRGENRRAENHTPPPPPPPPPPPTEPPPPLPELDELEALPDQDAVVVLANELMPLAKYAALNGPRPLYQSGWDPLRS